MLAVPQSSSLRRLVLFILLQRTWPRAARYALAVVIIGMATGAVYALPGPDDVLCVLLFVPAIFVAALLFDRGSGFVATGMAALAANALFMERLGGVLPYWRDDMVVLLVFVVVGAALAIVAELLHAYLERTLLRERESALLLQETTHSIRNHLQLAAGLLRLQARRKGGAEELRTAADRIGALAGLYDRLTVRPTGTRLDAARFIEGVVGELRHVIGPRPVTVTVQIDEIELDGRRASVVGLIVNELVTNAIKHAFPDGRAGTIAVHFRRLTEDWLELEVRDDGVGVREGDGPAREGLGRSLVTQLAEQVGGTVVITAEDGTRTTVRLPADSVSHS